MSRTVPQLRFPEFEGDWDEIAFDDAFTSVPTKKHQVFASEFQQAGLFPVIDQGADFMAGFSDDRSKVYSDVPIIAFGDHTTILKYVDFPFVVGADGVKLIKSQVWNIQFSYYALSAFPVVQDGYKRHFSALRDREFSAPSLLEQQKIADFLGTVDAKLDALRRKKSGLEAFKSGLMQRLFSQEIRFTREDGTDFPDWEERTLGDILTVCYGKDHKALPDGAIPVYGTGGIMRHVDRELWHGPSILIGRKGTIDRPMLVDGPFWTVDTLFYTRIQEGINPRLAFGLIEQVDWAGLNEATGVPSLTSKAILSVRIVMPVDPDEQRKIADALSAMDAKIAAVANQITHMETFKKGLLQQMFV